MDKDNCLYIQNVCSYKPSGILFELKVIRATTCMILFNIRFLRYRIIYRIFTFFNQKIFPKIKFILGNNAVELPRVELGSELE